MTRFLLTLHQWIGLFAGIFLVVIGVTGSALVFEAEIDRALHPALSYVNVRGRPLPLETLLAHTRDALPKDFATGIHIGDKPDLAYEMLLSSGQLAAVDPYTGSVLGVRDRGTGFVTQLHLLHTSLLSDRFGEQVVGWLCVAMLFQALSGVYLWWPRKILAVRSASSWKRTNFDLHNVFGFYSSIVLVAITLSGALIAFEATTDPLIRRLDRNPPAAETQSLPVPGEARIPLDAAVALAERALPGAAATIVNLPAASNSAIRVLMRFPEDRTPAGRSLVYLDQFSGKVLAVENTRTAPLGTRILNLKRSAHTGDVLGAPTRVLYFIVGLAVAVQAMTGALIAWNGRGFSTGSGLGSANVSERGR
jgi:uncharacterized iron-regulated membrane protein